ncbi:MAG TPA: tetratricopeptide repeat protein [Natronosporangium sp.]
MSVSGGRGIQVGDHNIQTNIEVDASRLPPPQTVSPGPGTVHNLPATSAVFVGRDLEALARLLGGEGAGAVVGQAAVHGLGGIGKTELAAHYARAHLNEFSLVWWITADSPENINLGLAALTRRLHSVAVLADAQEWAIGWLQSHTGWLLVLDNVEDVEHVRPLLGQITGPGQVIVTTRRDLGAARWNALGLAPLRLDVLDRAASVELLIRLTGDPDQAGAGRLAEVLGDLPLALEQAAAYLSQQQVGFDDYRRLLTDQFTRLATQPGEGGSAQRTIDGVWRVTMDQIRRRSPLAAEVLAVIAWLAPEALPEDVLAPMADDPTELAEALALLASYSMISRAGGMVTVHRLVQAVTRADAEATGADDPGGMAAELLADAAPEDPAGDVDGWPRWNQLLAHIDALLDYLDEQHTNLTALWLADEAATYRLSQGQVAAAIAQFERAVADSRRILGDDDPATWTFRNNLARAYLDAGRVGAAIPVFEQVLADRQRLFGDDHPATMTSRNNLAAAYRAAGRVGEAISLLEVMLTELTRTLGEDRPDVLATRNNLAVAYEAVGRVDEAIPLYEQLLADARRVLGEDNQETLTAGHNLASAYLAAGRVGESIALYERVLADARRVLGEDHPDTLATRSGLADAYLDVGEVGKAVALYEQVLVDRQRVLGEDHPDTLTSRSGLAEAYLELGRVGQAIALFERVLADRRRVLGEDHPHTLIAGSNLARAFLDAGRVGEAITRYEQLLADARRVLGEDDPTILIARSNLATAYLDVGRVDEAIALFERVLADRRRVLGENHPNTLTARNNLAGAYQDAGRVDEAIALYEQLLADRRRILDDDHPDALTTRNNLGSGYLDAGRVDEAIALFEQVLADRRRVLGDDHPNVLATRNNLASAYRRAGRVDAAIELYEQLLADARRVLGDGHTLTQTIVSNLDAALAGSETPPDH